MARIEGVDLPRNKRVEIGLTYIYGIGLPTTVLLNRGQFDFKFFKPVLDNNKL